MTCCLVAFCVLERDRHDRRVSLSQLKRRLSFKGRSMALSALERLRSPALPLSLCLISAPWFREQKRSCTTHVLRFRPPAVSDGCAKSSSWRHLETLLCPCTALVHVAGLACTHAVQFVPGSRRVCVAKRSKSGTDCQSTQQDAGIEARHVHRWCGLRAHEHDRSARCESDGAACPDGSSETPGWSVPSNPIWPSTSPGRTRLAFCA